MMGWNPVPSALLGGVFWVRVPRKAFPLQYSFVEKDITECIIDSLINVNLTNDMLP